MDAPTPQMRQCIETCLECYSTCLGAATNHCLVVGGKHVESGHFKLMLACAEMCRLSAHFMILNVPSHKETCAGCASICEACAQSCEEVGDMEGCVEACRACAKSCREMAA